MLIVFLPLFTPMPFSLIVDSSTSIRRFSSTISVSQTEILSLARDDKSLLFKSLSSSLSFSIFSDFDFNFTSSDFFSAHANACCLIDSSIACQEVDFLKLILVKLPSCQERIDFGLAEKR